MRLTLQRARDAAIRTRWSIGMLAGTHPLALRPIGAGAVLRREDVTDTLASFVADPFMIQVDGGWHMFFEVLSAKAPGCRGVIAHAASADGLRWRYDRIVLAEPFHVSYPHVFADGSDVYMVLESWRAGAVRLYRADPFPDRWVHVDDLVTGDVLLDPSLLHHGGRWWMFVESSRRWDTLRLLCAPELRGPWTEHPASPVVRGDPRRSRPAGRVVAAGERLYRFAQDCYPEYGTAVRAFEITELTPAAYGEREVEESPVLGPGGARWNSGGMHQLDAHRLADGTWLACADGRRSGLIQPRELANFAADRFLRAARARAEVE